LGREKHRLEDLVVITRILAVLGMGTVLLVVGTAIAAERTVTLAVDNMYGSACPYTVKQSLAEVTGVNKAAVSYEKKLRSSPMTIRRLPLRR
jgi:hypothetical protein